MHILFADDESSLQNLMKNRLEKLGHSVVVCPDGETAVAALEMEPFDCLIVDLNMPGIKGAEVVVRAKELQPNIEAVVMTGNPDLESALTAIENHVFAFVIKPCSFRQIETLLSGVFRRLSQFRRIAALEHRVRQAEGDSQLVGSGNAMQAVRHVISKVGPTESTVLIRGETGCGKELVARAVHQASLRADEPMVSINCGALPENLIESELFGHVKGAFTGADSARVGLFEVADGGTIFLDEIGELPITMQAKLLRVLETGDIRKLGSNQSKRVDVRVICATHRDLDNMVQEELFREDLMFRINTFEVHVPSLRERPEDIIVLAEHLLRRHRNDAESGQSFSPDATTELTAHKWPGNVRELANVVEHAAILCDRLPIEPQHLPQHFTRRQLRSEIRESGPMTMRQIEWMAIERAMERNNGDKKAAAEELGVSVKTLYNRINAAAEDQAA
ncbi:MAG: sigma-54 dependent transcriptional regulator [Planctomycetota bacterium]